ncbi:hypothetical protein K502DRAFT_218044 [Neoconidiobolus thromboides FSU 785]|nr:hypothetical protein K502DRAFT_218044 [Neoconidiobolus thromboides FSU 785]
MIHNSQEDNYYLIEAIQILNERKNHIYQLVEEWEHQIISSSINNNQTYLLEDPTISLLTGIERLKQHLNKEAQHLSYLLENEDSIYPYHLTCSNLPYLEAVYLAAKNQQGLVTLFKTFSYNIKIDGEIINEKITIDIIANHGLDWIKVSARNTKYLISQSKIVNEEEEMEEMGDDNTELSEIENKAYQMKCAAIENQIHFKIPNIKFSFLNINFNQPYYFPLINKLLQLNIIPEKINSNPSSTLSLSDKTNLSTEYLNLDCTTLIALASELTNSYNTTNNQLSNLKVEHYNQMNALKIQIESELKKPLMPILIHLLKGHQLTTTRECYERFFSIVSTIAGEKEKLRANILFRHYHQDNELIHQDTLMLPNDPFLNFKLVTNQSHAYSIEVLDNIIDPNFEHFLSLNFHKLYTSFHMLVFGSAYQRKMSTITANTWITRALLDKAPYLKDTNFILLHEPRSFVENKLKF